MDGLELKGHGDFLVPEEVWAMFSWTLCRLRCQKVTRAAPDFSRCYVEKGNMKENSESTLSRQEHY